MAVRTDVGGAESKRGFTILSDESYVDCLYLLRLAIEQHIIQARPGAILTDTTISYKRNTPVMTEVEGQTTMVVYGYGLDATVQWIEPQA